MTLQVRPLSAADLGGFEALVAESETEEFRFLRRLHGEWMAGSVPFDDADAYFLGVFDGGELIAVGGVTPDPYLADARTGRIRHLYVARAHRRRGIGRLLLAELEARARDAFDVLRLRTETPEASRFYESIGYTSITDASATHLRDLRGS